MKKYLLLFASAALLLVGCAKEKFAEPIDGGLTNVTFTASLDNGVATKAAVDGDGAAANVNRCIMEIYYGDALFTRQIKKVTNKQASFTVQVVSNRKYTVAFWADHVEQTTDDGLQIDNYYDTRTNGLKAVALKGTYAGNIDARDAFALCKEYTIAQAGSAFQATLRRPFAQINVISTDVATVAEVSSLKPEKVKVVLKNAATSYNVLDSTAVAGNTANLTYIANIYNWDATKQECTLSMDYIFAEKEKAVIDIDWKAQKTGDADVEHAFAAVPYQRNFRTNIKGTLLTTQGQWTVTVDPEWTTPEYTHPVVIATTLEEAQAAVGPATSGAEAAGTVIVKPEAVTNRDQTKDKEKSYVEDKTSGIELPIGAKAIEFVLTPQSKEDVTFELPALPDENFYWYIRHEPDYPTKNLNVKVSEGDVTRVIIDAPNNTHVVLNDVEYDHVIAITGPTTLVVPKGIKVDKLTVKKGGVEIHGEVGELEITGTEEEVFFRSCEGLSATVFAVIKDEGHNYIKTPQYTEKLNSDGTYDIVSSVCKIGETYYGSLADAFKAVPTDAAAAATVITVVADANETFKTRGAELKKDQKVILDLNGYKLVGTSTDPGYTQYIYVENGGELTVKDSRTGGVIEYHDGYIENLTSGSGTGGSAITCHGCMTLESGTIENKTPDTKTNDLEGAIDMYTNAWGQAYSPADIVLNINGGVVKSNNANTIRLTSFSAQSYTTSVTVNMNGGEVYGRDGFFIQGVSESYLNTNTLNLNSGKVYGTQAVRVMAWQNHENASESKPVTIRIREGVDIQNNYFAQSTKTGWSEGICIDNLSGTFEQLLSYVNIIKGGVCKIENTIYPTLEAAVAAATPLAQIRLIDDCAEEVTVAKNVELFTDGFKFTGKLTPATGFYTFDKDDISNLGDFSSFYPTGMDYITLAYPSAEVHNIDCSGGNIKFETNILETAYSFNAFDTQITRGDTGMTDMALMTLVLGEPDFTKLLNFDFDFNAFVQAFEELTEEPKKNRVNEIISSMLPYLPWIADFEVHFDRDVAANSLGVSGFYGSYAKAEGGGFGMDISTPEISDGSTYRMLYDYSNGAMQIPYAGICLAVRTFDCGAYRITNDVAGTEMTVDLCLYNSDQESEVKKIVVGTYSYTFPEIQQAK